MDSTEELGRNEVCGRCVLAILAETLALVGEGVAKALLIRR